MVGERIMARGDKGAARGRHHVMLGRVGGIGSGWTCNTHRAIDW